MNASENDGEPAQALFYGKLRDCLFGEQNGLMGWLCTAGVIVAWDAYAITQRRETMSHAFHRGMEHPIMKFMCVGALGGLAVHLCHGVEDEATA